jgi:hypothetical protein
MVIQKSIKPKPTIKTVIVLTVSVCIWLYAVMSWNKFVIIIFSDGILKKYYSQKEIDGQNLYLIFDLNETKISNGNTISQIDHENLRTNIFKWSFFPRVFWGLCWFFWLVSYLKKFDVSPPQHNNTSTIIEPPKNKTKKKKGKR